MCLGVYLALLEIRTALKLMLRTVHFTHVHISDEQDDGTFAVALRPSWAQWVYVTQRVVHGGSEPLV
jgi:cytochrome P450